jgi:antitoxin component YwqK of YwqJK toxin-antitoxin module
MRNRIVMLFVFAFLSSIVWAQDEAALLRTQAFAARFYLPEEVLNLLPYGLNQKVDRWEKTGHKGRILTGWYANGQKAVVFALKGGHLHGQWQTWYENGIRKEEGHFSNGHPDGTWQFWYASGVLKSTRSFSASKMQSWAIANRQRNPKLQFVPLTGNEPSSKETATLNPAITEASHGLLHIDLPFRRALNEGDFVNFDEMGSVVEQGKFVNGLRDGQWLYQNQKDSKIITGYYSNGLKHGPWKEMKGDTMLLLEEYKDGMLVHRKLYGH